MKSDIRGPLWGEDEGSGIRDQGSGIGDQGPGPTPPGAGPLNLDPSSPDNPQSAIRNPQSEEPPADRHQGWSRAQPEHLSLPTYWPAVMALGVTMLLWGIVTSVIISIVGLALFALALVGWIGELLHENPEQ